MRRFALLLMLPALAWAQPRPPTGADMMFTAQPDEILTIACEYGVALSTVQSVTVTLLSGTDASPSAMVTNSAVSGTRLSYVVTPTGRHGNKYQIHALANATSGDRLACDVRADISTVRYVPR